MLGLVVLTGGHKKLPDIATPNLNAPPVRPKTKARSLSTTHAPREASNMSVYVLELEGGRYYVGYTDDVPRRIAEHFMARGAHWTRTHPPVKVLEVVPGNKELENATTIALMCKYGWRNVRGGTWCSVEMRSMPTPPGTSPGAETAAGDPRRRGTRMSARITSSTCRKTTPGTRGSQGLTR